MKGLEEEEAHRPVSGEVCASVEAISSGESSRRGTAVIWKLWTLFLTVDILVLLPVSLPEKCKGQVPCTPISRDPSAQALPVPWRLSPQAL